MTRGSLRTLNIGPEASLRSASWASSRSAPRTIVRNLNMVNGLPPRPMRCCRYRTGPLEVSLISRARTSQTGATKTRTTIATERSKARFAAASSPERRTGRRESTSRLPTGSTVSRELRMFVIFAETRISTLDLPRCLVICVICSGPAAHMAI